MATLRHLCANILAVPHTMIRLSLMKIFYPRNIFWTGIERFSPNVVVDTDSNSKILFGERVSIHSGGRFSAVSGGQLSIGDRTSFNVGCIVACRNKVSIGENVAFGPNVMVYDHNHIMNSTDGVRNTGYSTERVIIGNNCWIGAGTIILSGTSIGNNCVIAAGSVVKGVVPEATVLIQKRMNTYTGVE